MTTITLIQVAPSRPALVRPALDRRGRNRTLGWVAAFAAGAALWTGAIAGVVAVVTALG
jgi:hypothetical protein